MFSIRAHFKNGQFHLKEPFFFEGTTEVIVTFVNNPLVAAREQPAQELTEAQATALRKYKRFVANGKIILTRDNVEETMQLIDYSGGGLSFASLAPFEKGLLLKAALKDPLDLQHSVLEFEFEVARSISKEHHYQVGCKFTDNIDEELWHSLMRMH